MSYKVLEISLCVQQILFDEQVNVLIWISKHTSIFVWSFVIYIYIYIICKSTLFAIALPYTSGCAVPTTVSATATFTQKSTDVYPSEMIYKVYGDFLRDMNSIENEMCKIYTVLFISILLIVIGKKD